MPPTPPRPDTPAMLRAGDRMAAAYDSVVECEEAMAGRGVVVRAAGWFRYRWLLLRFDIAFWRFRRAQVRARVEATDGDRE